MTRRGVGSSNRCDDQDDCLGSLPVEPNRPGDGVGGLPLHPGHHVGVAVQGELGRGVAQPLADHPDRDPGLDCDRGVSVTQVVEPDPGQVGFLDDPLEGLARASEG